MGEINMRKSARASSFTGVVQLAKVSPALLVANERALGGKPVVVCASFARRRLLLNEQFQLLSNKTLDWQPASRAVSFQAHVGAAAAAAAAAATAGASLLEAAQSEQIKSHCWQRVLRQLVKLNPRKRSVRAPICTLTQCCKLSCSRALDLGENAQQLAC